MSTDPSQNGPAAGPDLNDRDTVRTAIVSPSEVWHVARLEAFRHLLRWIENEPGPGHHVLAKLRQVLEASAGAEWLGFVSHASRTDAQRQAFLSGGEPDHIALDQSEGVAVAAWMNNNPAFSDAFGVFQVKPEGVDTHISAVSTNPFRLVDLTRLPAGGRAIPVLDARHTATAAVSAILHSADADIDAMKARYVPQDCWRALRTHAQFFKAVARAAMDQIKGDDFRDWNKDARPILSRFEDAPRFIHDRAGSVRCQQALALTLFADHYLSIQEKIERAHPHDYAARIEATQKAIVNSVQQLDMTLAGMNGSILVQAGLDPHTVQVEVIFQTIPRGMPSLVVIPLSTLSAPAPLRQ